MSSHSFLVLSSLFFLVSNAQYILSTLRGTVQPNRVTWIMWALASFITTAAQIASGIGWASFPVFMAGFGPFVIFLCTFVNKKAYWKSSVSDYICGGFSLLGLVLWALTKDPNFAILLSILSDLLAGIPTMRKAITHPESESPLTFLLSLFGVIFGLLAQPHYDFTSSAFLVYLLSANVFITVILYVHKMRDKLRISA